MKQSVRAWLFLLPTLGPAACLGYLVHRCGIDVPFWDEWHLVPALFAKARAHQLSWSDLFTQANEHRILFPRLIFLLLERLAGWHPRLEMFLSVGVATLSGFCLLFLLRRTVPLKGPALLAVALLCNLLLFSPAQHENWLWGYQIACFLLIFCLFAGAAVLSSEFRRTTKFTVAATVAVIATYSGGNGILLWPALLGCYLLSEAKLAQQTVLTWAIAWLVLAAGAISLYFIGYRKPPYHPPLAASASVLDYFYYIVGFLGAPLGLLDESATVVGPLSVGALLLAGFAVLVSRVVLRWREQALRRAAAPWLTVAAFAVGSDLLACTSRIGFGPVQALSSRYTTFALPFSIACVALSTIVIRHRRLRVAVCGLIALLFIASVPYRLEMMEKTAERRARGALALRFLHLAPQKTVLESSIFPQLPLLTALAREADALHLLPQSLLREEDIDDFVHAARTNEAASGAITQVSVADDGAQIVRGWIRAPRGDRTSAGVLLTCNDATSARRFVGLTFEFRRSDSDVPARDARPWQIQFARDRLPPGATTLEAWLIDARPFTVQQIATASAGP